MIESHARIRRFTLADSMVVIAATAPGFALVRMARDLGLFVPDPGMSPARMWIEYLTVSAVPLIACLMLIPMGLGLLDRKAGRREATSGPGFIASAAALSAWPLPMAWASGHLLLYQAYAEPRVHHAVTFNNTFASLSHIACPMILGAWLAMGLLGRWRPLPAWPDRLGIGLAVLWLLLWAYSELYFIAEPIRKILLG